MFQSLSLIALLSFALNLGFSGASAIRCCPSTFNPLCTPEGKRYMNECFARRETSATLNVCPPAEDKPRSNLVCEDLIVPAPVCASNGKTYRNECEARAFDVKIVLNGTCKEFLCPSEFVPVCGTDGWVCS